MPFVLLITNTARYTEGKGVKEIEAALKKAWVETGKAMNMDCQATDVGGTVLYDRNPDHERCLFIYNYRGEDFHGELELKVTEALVGIFGWSTPELVSTKAEQWFEDPAWTVKNVPVLIQGSEQTSPFPGPDRWKHY